MDGDAHGPAQGPQQAAGAGCGRREGVQDETNHSLLAMKLCWYTLDIDVSLSERKKVLAFGPRWKPALNTANTIFVAPTF